ncbi:MAG: hypothetical protein AB1427_16090 [Thermodesulfobacteriota bacterium]
MKWIEMIRLIGQDDSHQTVDGLIVSEKNLIREQGALNAGVYANPFYANDLCLYFLWDTNNPQLRGSRAGLNISETLKGFGLVEHSVWVPRKQILYACY